MACVSEKTYRMEAKVIDSDNKDIKPNLPINYTQALANRSRKPA